MSVSMLTKQVRQLLFNPLTASDAYSYQGKAINLACFYLQLPRGLLYVQVTWFKHQLGLYTGTIVVHTWDPCFYIQEELLVEEQG